MGFSEFFVVVPHGQKDKSIGTYPLSQIEMG
jgi:hypothetical protein